MIQLFYSFKPIKIETTNLIELRVFRNFSIIWLSLLTISIALICFYFTLTAVDFQITFIVLLMYVFFNLYRLKKTLNAIKLKEKIS